MGLDRVSRMDIEIMGHHFHVGTAGWSIASRHNEEFPTSGTHFQRYARRLNCVEINSSFYRPHLRETYARWADSAPECFRFSVKIPKSITHQNRLVGCDDLLDRFLGEAEGLGPKLAVLLVQIPPTLKFEAGIAELFFRKLLERPGLKIAFEPRHPSWFGPDAEALLTSLRIARVAADPATIRQAALPGGWPDLAYFRFHGSPRIYFSDYPPELLRDIGRQLKEAMRSAAEVWCIFDNTAASHALANALAVSDATERRLR